MGLFNMTYGQSRVVRNQLILIYWYLKHAKISKQERTYLNLRLLEIEKNLPRIPAFMERAKWRLVRWVKGKKRHGFF